MLGKDYGQQDCSLARALEVIGERWTLLIVRDAFFGVRRFNDLQAHLDIPKAVLSDRLCGLVEDGVLERRPDPRHKGRHLYELTAAGRDLWPALHALLMWGDRYRYRSSRVFKHAGCGRALDRSGSCTTCAVTPGPGDVVVELRTDRPVPPKPRQDPVWVAMRQPHRLLDPIET